MRNIFIVLFISILFAGCATPPQGPAVVATTALPAPYPNGVYHIVLPKQTLWRIAKAYNKDINQIIDINKISDPTKIERGQRIFIPDAKNAITGELPAPSQEMQSEGYVWPVKGKVISYYGQTVDNVKNKGVDIAASYGSNVAAARSGKVVFTDDKVKGMGKTVIVEHSDGLSTLYGYNSEILVSCGDTVRAGQPIARVGNSGRAKTTSLHFEVRKGHEPQNPFYYLP